MKSKIFKVPKLTLILPIFFIYLTGCQKESDIKTYRISKEAESPMPGMMGGAMNGGAGNPPMGGEMNSGMSGSGMGNMNMESLPDADASVSKEIQWKVPSGWKEQPASQMRVGSFLVKSKNNMDPDVSVIPLSGPAGGDLGNINRWRGQISLDPINETDLPNNMQIISAGGHKMRFVNFVSKEPLINNQYKKRLIAAYCTVNDRTWFIKMIGEDKNVQSSKESFIKFLSSLKFNH